MNGLAITIIVGPAPQAVRLLDRRRRLRRRGPPVLRQPRPDQHDRARARRLGRSRCCLVLPRFTQQDPGGARRRRRRHRRLGRPRPGGQGVDGRARSRRACPSPSVPWTSSATSARSLAAAVGHHARVADRHDRHVDELRRPARRRGRPEPGDDRHGRRQHRRPGFFQGFAISTSGSRTAVAEQSGAKTQVTGLVGAGIVALLLLAFNGLLADLPQTALAAVVIAAALSLIDLVDPRVATRVCAARRSPSRSSRPSA